MPYSSGSKTILLSVLFCLTFSIGGLTIQAGLFEPEMGNPLFESWRWTMFPEISSQGVRCMIEGENGEVWFGAADGVYRYNGLRWIHYAEENELLQSPVYGLHLTQSGNLYAVTLSGICHFMNGNWETDMLFPEQNILGSEWEVLNIAETDDGDIWVGLYFGLVRLRDDEVTLFTSHERIQGLEALFEDHDIIYLDDLYPAIPNFIVSFLLEDQTDNLWLGLEDGRIVMIEGGADSFLAGAGSTVFTENDGLLLSRLPVIYELSDGSIITISQSVGGGLNRYNKFTGQWTSQKLSTLFGGDDLYFSIQEFSDGTIWIGGLSRFFELRNNTWYEYKQPDLAVPQTRIIFRETSDGSIWLGGLMSDVFRIEYQSEIWNTFLDLNYECETPEGTQYFLHGSGNIVIRNSALNSWEMITKEETGIDAPLRIFCDQGGNIWILGSTAGRAAIAFNHSGYWQVRPFTDLCWAFSPTAAFQDSHGMIWFSGSTDCGEESNWGLVRYDPETGDPMSDLAWQSFPGAEICEVAYALGETEAGALFCGYYKGLYEYSGNTTRPLHTALINDMMKIECIEKDISGSLWIGTRSKGVMYFEDEENWQFFTTEDGLPSNTITGILVSIDSTVWVATDKGISRYDGQGWQSSALPAYFTIPRGGGTIRQSPDGTIWINQNDLSWYRRVYFGNTFDSVSTPLTAYKIRIESLPPETRITRYDEKVFYPGNTTIYWEGIDQWNQSSMEELSYSYKLDDEPWSEFTNQTSHTFLALKRGKHTIQVRTRDKYLNIDPTPAVVELKRIPPIWGQVWFILVVLLTLISLSYLFLDTVRKGRAMKAKNLEMEAQNENLKKQQQEIQEKSAQIMELLESERENKWLNEGIVMIGNTIRKNRDDLQTLARELLSQLINYLDVQYGGFFVHRKSESEEYLELIASYGFDNDRSTKKKIATNEGITGACFTDKKSMRIENLPETYVMVSGLGKSKLQCLLLIPLKLHGDTVGVLEIASVRDIEDKAMRLLETIAETIASNLISLDARDKIQKLYEASQEQTSKLHEQEEEMRQQMEELQATQEENHRREEKLLAEIAELKKKLKGKK